MCLRFWNPWGGTGANKKRKIYHCRTMNSNVKVIGDMESEIAWVVRLRRREVTSRMYGSMLFTKVILYTIL